VRIRRLLSGPPAMHRFPRQISDAIGGAIRHIRAVYGGDASRIWRDRPSSAEVVFRFLEFPGIGPKIATMAANILARQLKVPFSDYFALDISVDIHVRRVFRRLGLVRPDASVDEVIYRALVQAPLAPMYRVPDVRALSHSEGAPRATRERQRPVAPSPAHQAAHRRDHRPS